MLVLTLYNGFKPNVAVFKIPPSDKEQIIRIHSRPNNPEKIGIVIEADRKIVVYREDESTNGKNKG